MSAVFPLEVAPVQDDPDQRVRLHAVGWADYEVLLAMRGESPVPRISYLEGELELMSPSADLLLRCMQEPTQTAAVKAYRAALKGSP